MTGIGTNDKYQHKGETAYFMEMQKMRQYGCAGVNVHGRIGGNMDRFFLITTLMMMSMTMLFASNAFVAQGTMTTALAFPTISISGAFASGGKSIAKALNSCGNFILRNTGRVAWHMADAYNTVKVFADSTVVSIENTRNIQVCG
jgi:hypothetical protein